jgi:hypothetical protein
MDFISAVLLLFFVGSIYSSVFTPSCSFWFFKNLPSSYLTLMICSINVQYIYSSCLVKVDDLVTPPMFAT